MFNLHYYAKKIKDYENITVLPEENIAELTNITVDKDASCAFFVHCNSYCRKLETLSNVETTWDTSNTVNMSHMFRSLTSLKDIDLSKLNTSNAIYMNSIFYDCSSLTRLDVSKLDTSKAKSISDMFNGCKSLITLDLSNFNTSNVSDWRGLKNMFSTCTSLESVKFNFNTAKVTNTNGMFYDCRKIKIIPFIDTFNVKDMGDMFAYCKSLPKEFPWIINCKSIDDTFGLKNMFNNSSVEYVKLSNINNNIRNKVTSELLKGDNTLTIEFM